MLTVPACAVSPASPSSRGSGLSRIRLPPALTQAVSAVTWASVMATSPSTTTSYAASVAADRLVFLRLANSLSPSARTISTRYDDDRFASLVTTAIGPPGPASMGGGGGAEVWNDQLVGAMTLPLESVAPLTLTV